MTVSAEPPFQPSPEPSLEDQGATLRALSPIYSALVREFVIETAPCPINDSDDEGFVISPESVENAAAWFEQIDAKIQVHQLRQFLQTTPLPTKLRCAIFSCITCRRP